MEAVDGCTVNGEFLVCCVVKMLRFLSKTHTPQFLIFASLFQLKRLSSLLLLSLARQERRICVHRGPTVSSGSWELICSAVPPLPWQKKGQIIFWFPLLGENAGI